MQVYVRKEVQAFEYVSFTELKKEKNLDFCCVKFRKYSMIVNSWSNKIGKFSLVEDNKLIPIDFCPFCGQKIEYIEVE